MYHDRPFEKELVFLFKSYFFNLKQYLPIQIILYQEISIKLTLIKIASYILLNFKPLSITQNHEIELGTSFPIWKDYSG